MVDGNIEMNKLSLKETALDVAGSEDKMKYDEFTKVYYISGVGTSALEGKDFKLFQKTSRGNPVYKKGNIFAELDILAGEDNIFMYKCSNNKWKGEE